MPAPARRLCRLDELADGRSKGFDPLGEGRDTMFVVRHGAEVFGYRNACPHYDFARMAWKKDEFLNADHTLIQCGAHGALFRIEDGVAYLAAYTRWAIESVLFGAAAVAPNPEHFNGIRGFSRPGSQLTIADL